MTVKELRDKLDNLMISNPNVTDDEIYYLYDGDNEMVIDNLSIEYDINSQGRYICLT